MKLVFICTGNTCRSPMAEKILKRKLEEKGIKDVTVESAGLFASGSSPMAENAQIALKLMGIDNVSHVSRFATPQYLKKFDLIITMTQEQKKLLENCANVYSIGEYCESEDIQDPYGCSVQVYTETAERISELCDIIVKKLKTE